MLVLHGTLTTALSGTKIGIDVNVFFFEKKTKTKTKKPYLVNRHRDIENPCLLVEGCQDGNADGMGWDGCDLRGVHLHLTPLSR